jgi:hypothetical protein
MKTRCFCSEMLMSVLVLVYSAPAVSQSKLVPLVTDQNSLQLSKYFATAGPEVINQRGDYAFIGGGNSSVFLRLAGQGAPVLVFQKGDEVPGIAGSRVDLINGVMLNDSGLLAFKLEFAPQTGELQGAILTYDGSSIRLIVSGMDEAPGTNGAHFERNIVMAGLNNNGDVALTAPLVPSWLTTAKGVPAQTTLFIVPSGGEPVRLAGPGDFYPGINGSFGPVGSVSLNNNGEALFSTAFSSGGSGLFVGSVAGGVRKVVASGDDTPLGGKFSTIGGGRLNLTGDVAFIADGVLWVNSPMTGSTSKVAAQGDPVPIDTDSRLNGAPTLQALNDAGEIAFTSGVKNTTKTYWALFRFKPNGSFEVVAYRNQDDPSDSSRKFTAFSAVSMNSSGVVSFRGTLSGTPTAYGIYRQEGSNMPDPVVLDGGSVPLPPGGTYWLSNSTGTRILNDGGVFFWADLVGGAAVYGDFLITDGTPRILMSTADTLPAESLVTFRTFSPIGAGDYVGITAHRNGGGCSLGAYNIAAREVTIAATDGDMLPSDLGGGRLWISNCSTSFVNSSGTVVFMANIERGTYPYTRAILMRLHKGELKMIAATGDVNPATGIRFSSLGMISMTPSPLNEFGQVVFSATDAGTSRATGLFVGAPDAELAKVAVIGETANGITIQSFASISSVSINRYGQVAFLANTQEGGTEPPAIFVATPFAAPPLSPVKIAAVGDLGPVGTTVSGLGFPAFNNDGEVVFMAALAGGSEGPRGGVFVSSATGLTVLALDGADAPEGGKFSITTPGVDVAINDQGDVAFRAGLIGTADAGYFLLRHGSGTLGTVVLTGWPAPGTGGVVYAINPSMNNYVGENFKLDPAGSFAFSCLYTAGDRVSVGVWHLKTDGSLEPMAVRGISVPEPGGLVLVNTNGFGSNSGGRYSFSLSISGAPFRDGIFLFVPPPIANAGADQTKECCSHAGATFTLDGSGSSDPHGDPLSYLWQDADGKTVGNGASIILTRLPGTYTFTLTVTNLLCGGSSNSATHVTIQDTVAPTLDVKVTPNLLWPANNKPVEITASIQAIDACDPAPRVALVSITSNEPLQPDDIQGAVFGSDCRTFMLRATRQGMGTGRIYTITYRVTDAAGNFVLKTVEVVVPRDVGKR